MKIELTAKEKIAPKKKYIWLLVSLVCFVGFGGLYFYLTDWRISLLNSVKAINASIQKYDARKFQKYVDLNSLFSRMIDDSMRVGMEPTSDDFATSLARGMAAMMKPVLVQNLINETTRMIEMEQPSQKDVTGPSDTGRVDPEIISVEDVGKYASQMSDIFRNFSKKIKSIKKSGHTAIIEFLYQPASKDNLLIELKFRSMGSYWQLAEVANFAEILKTKAYSQVADANDKTPTTTEEQQYLSNVKLEDVKVGKGYGKFDIPRDHSPSRPVISGKIRNVGSRTLANVEVVIYFKNKLGQTINEKRFLLFSYHKYALELNLSLMGSSEPLEPYEVRDFHYIVKGYVPSEWDGQTVDVQVSEIQF